MTDHSTSTPPSPAPLNPTRMGTVVPEDQAKQGRRGFHVLAIMIVSVVLLVAIYIGIWASHARPTADTGVQAATQRTVTATKTTP